MSRFATALLAVGLLAACDLDTGEIEATVPPADTPPALLPASDPATDAIEAAVPPTDTPPALLTPMPKLSWPWPLLDGPGIARADGKFSVVATEAVPSPRFAFPAPLDFEDQVPLHFSLVVTPTEAMMAADWVQRNAHNWVVEVTLQPMQADQTVEFEWTAYVLIRGHDYSALPAQVPIPTEDELPPEVRPWLRATACVQVDDSEIQAEATMLRGEGNVVAVAQRVADFTANRIPQEGEFSSLDAVEALHEGGSCTSAVNLAAALLRANGIPARSLALYPTDDNWWQTHYLVEFYVPEYGWVWLESTMGEVPWLPYGGVVVSVVYPEDEDRGWEWEGRWAMQCVPWGSLTEHIDDSSLTLSAGGTQWCDHKARAVRAFADLTQLEEAFALAERVWQADLALKSRGEGIPGAQACQQEAVRSDTLEEAIAHLQDAALLYSERSQNEPLLP